MLLNVFAACLTFYFVTSFEYSINFERLVLAYYDKSVVKDGYFFFGKYNRTNFCLNLSFVLLEDLDGNDMTVTLSPFQFLSNQYKPIGYILTYNVCEAWKKDVDGSSKYLRQFGNLEGCDIKKGHYYLYNYLPDKSQFPKYLPLGNYMAEMKVVRSSGSVLLRFQWFADVKLKFNYRRKKTR